MLLQSSTVEERECIHGLTPDTCSLCLHGPRLRKARQGGPITGYKSMIARYDSRCPYCHTEIAAGDRIYRPREDDVGPWECRSCAERDTDFT